MAFGVDWRSPIDPDRFGLLAAGSASGAAKLMGVFSRCSPARGNQRKGFHAGYPLRVIPIMVCAEQPLQDWGRWCVGGIFSVDEYVCCVSKF